MSVSFNHFFADGINRFDDDLIGITKRDIEEINHLGGFHELYRNKRPVVVQGIASKWKALELLSLIHI